MKYNKGFSLAEIVVSVAILTAVGYTFSIFQKDIFSLNTTLQNNLSAQLEARHVLKDLGKELREASPSSLGAYPVALASSTTLTFYTDINNDGLKERIRYFLSGTTLKKGVIVPSGSPLVYNTANEKISTVVSNVINSTTTPVFDYFDDQYTGTSSPLVQPVDPVSVRLVRITVIIDKDPNRPPLPITVTTQITIRNVKDNL
jgi:type II secretory pathway component PulJ